MKKINKKDNTLIKKKNLVFRLKQGGIKRVSSDAVFLLENYFSKELDNMTCILKEEIMINARKTLKKQDVKNVLEKRKTVDEDFEI